MVKLSLYVTATLDGIASLRPIVPTRENDEAAVNEYFFCFKVKCAHCRETHPKPIHISAHESLPVTGGRGDANFVFKCKNCGKESNATILDFTTEGKGGKSKPGVIVGELALSQAENQEKAKILDVECRGCEFTEFVADGLWCAQSAYSKTLFKEIDLSEGEWYDYEESQGVEVSITEVKWYVDRTK